MRCYIPVVHVIPGLPSAVGLNHACPTLFQNPQYRLLENSVPSPTLSRMFPRRSLKRYHKKKYMHKGMLGYLFKWIIRLYSPTESGNPLRMYFRSESPVNGIADTFPVLYGNVFVVCIGCRSWRWGGGSRTCSCSSNSEVQYPRMALYGFWIYWSSCEWRSQSSVLFAFQSDLSGKRSLNHCQVGTRDFDFLFRY